MIVVTTDVFCNGCNEWTDGVAATKKRVRRARGNARKNGWAVRRFEGNLVDLCPQCQKKDWRKLVVLKQCVRTWDTPR